MATQDPCPCKGCRFKARQNSPLCAWHWLQIPPQLRAQIRLNQVPVSFAVLMTEAREAQDKRQEKIDNEVSP